jgi:type II secretory pathway pseudopilin PulG
MIEMLVAVIIMGLVLTIGAQLFQTAIRAGQAAGQSHDAASSFDAAVATLRGDVWGATSIEAPTPGTTATMKLAGDRSVTWSVTGNAISRAQSGVPSRVWTIPADITFAAAGPELVLKVRPTKSSPTGEVRIASQVHVLRKLAS